MKFESTHTQKNILILLKYSHTRMNKYKEKKKKISKKESNHLDVVVTMCLFEWVHLQMKA